MIFEKSKGCQDGYSKDKTIQYYRNQICKDNVSMYKNRIKVKGIPWEFPNELLKSLLERYGRVDTIIDCSWRVGKYRGRKDSVDDSG